MPTYEYACRDCGEHVEVVQSFKEAPLETCGLCGGALRKVFSAAGIIFKGSGYYVTDSRKKAESKSGAKSEPASGASGSGTSEKTASSDSPPAASDAPKKAASAPKAESA